MKEVLRILDRVGGTAARGVLEHTVHRQTGGELTDELLRHLEQRGYVSCPNGNVSLTDAGAAAIEESVEVDEPESAAPPDPAPEPEPAPTEAVPPLTEPDPEPEAQAAEESAPAVTGDLHADALALKEQGLPYAKIAEELGIERKELGKILTAAARRKRAGLPPSSGTPASPEVRSEEAPRTVRQAAADARSNDQARRARPAKAPPAAASRSSGLLDRLRRRRADLEAQIALLDDVIADLEDR